MTYANETSNLRYCLYGIESTFFRKSIIRNNNLPYRKLKITTCKHEDVQRLFKNLISNILSCKVYLKTTKKTLKKYCKFLFLCIRQG